jgi:mannose-6-phosphate isomerase-like protein (cupin superfamily)
VSYLLLKRDDLPHDGGTFDFQGVRYDNTDVSFIWVDMPPGDGVRLHQHSYKEIFIVLEGTSTFTVGADTVEAHRGDIIVAPANVPHKFVNSGAGRLKQIDIHLAPQFQTEWLED